MEYLTEEEKSYYINANKLDSMIKRRLSNNTYYILIKESEYRELIIKFLGSCKDLIDYCLYSSIENQLFNHVTKVEEFILGNKSLSSDWLSSDWFSHGFTFYEKQISPRTDTSLPCYIVDRTDLLNRPLCGHLIVFLNPNTNLGYSSTYKRNKEKLSNFLLLNNFAREDQILQGSIESIVSNLHYLTTLRPLFDYTWQKKPWSSNPKDHNPVVIKWLTPEQQQDKALIETLVNEYRLERL